MNKLKKLITAILIAGWATLIVAVGVSAQMGGGISVPSLWKKITGGVHPIVTTDTIGTSADRVAGVYADLLDGTSFVIGGAVVGDLTVGGSATAYGGFAGPTFVATSTLADSTFERLTWVNATGTNATSTNLFATNLSATNVLSSFIPSTNNTYDIGSPSLLWKNLFVGSVSATGNISPTADNTYNIGDVGKEWKNVNAEIVLANNQLIAATIRRGGAAAGFDIGVNDIGVRLNTQTQYDFVDSYFAPTSSNMADLGLSTKSWKDVYASGTVSINGTTLSGDGTLFTVLPPTGDYARIGDATVTSHTFNTNDDLVVAGKLEVNGVFYADSSSLFAGNVDVANNVLVKDGSNIGGAKFGSTAMTPDSSLLLTGAVSNAFHLAEYGDHTFDFAFPLQANPTFVIHSANQSTSEWIMLTHDQTDGFIGVPSGAIKIQGDLVPTSTNAYDLGSPSLSWENIYVSSTIFASQARIENPPNVTSTLFIGIGDKADGSRYSGQICLGDQDGIGFTCLTGNDGVMTAYSTSTY